MKAPDLPRVFRLYHQSAIVLNAVNCLLCEWPDWSTLKPITDKELDHGAKLRRVAAKLVVRTARRQAVWKQAVDHG